ncbi:Gfo/Idh/MocA family oxidoreductase [Rurimicrobium arvi]|uniref:Gfo/Idh/MocA family oxidoreductase n=1 Tax=Rurimicrobium arvi TaxID=2049916 RepID=A0ABP8MVX5_9BACT
MLNIGIFGAGHLGKIHIQQWKEIPQVHIVGFFDPDDTNAAAVAAQYQIRRFESPDALLAVCEAADIVTPTIFHHEIARKALLAGKHLFVEKPFTSTLEEAQELIKLAKEANVKCQVGHVERFNPALLALEHTALQPMFIESHRLATFNPRGTDVSVILDLMIHDIDIILHLVKSPVKRISASGVAVMSETPDIANARIEFDNGCVANLTSSRISLKRMRKMRLFQRDAYISVDFLDKKTEIIRLSDSSGNSNAFDIPLEMPNGDKKILQVENPAVPEINAIRMELAEFADAVINDKAVKVTAFDGYQAMEVAHLILKKMSLHNQIHNE